MSCSFKFPVNNFHNDDRLCHPKWGPDNFVSCPTLGATVEFNSCHLCCFAIIKKIIHQGMVANCLCQKVTS